MFGLGSWLAVLTPKSRPRGRALLFDSVGSPRARMPKEGNKRVNLSCLPCRSRKIKCDRNVPNCSSCVRRGIQHKCRWGDERDEIISRSGKSNNGDLVEGVVNEVMRRLDQKNSTERETYSIASATLSPCLGQGDHPGSRTWSQHIQWLPSRAECVDRVLYYTRHINPFINVVNSHQLLSQLDSFFLEGGSNATGVIWRERKKWGLASLIFAILQLVHDHTADPSDSTTKFHDAALYFMLNSDHMYDPTLWILQSMAVLREHLLHKVPFRAVIMWHSIAIRLAQSMGLHRLGSVVQDVHLLQSEPSDEDLDGPHSHSSLVQVCQNIRYGFLWGQHFSEGDLVSREIGRKVWHNLLGFDWLASNHANHTYVISDGSTFTAPPASLDDDEVLQLNARDPDVMDRLLDSQRPSEASYLRAMTSHAHSTRRLVDLENENRVLQGKSRLDQDTIISLDREYRSVLAALPEYFILDGVTELQSHVQQIHREKSYLTVQRFVLYQWVHYQLMVIHSPYLIPGLRGTSLRHHSDESIRSARFIIKMYRKIHSMDAPIEQQFALLAQVLFAALVLHFAIHIGQDVPDSDDIRQDICFSLIRLHTIFKFRGVAQSNEFSGMLRALESIYGTQTENHSSETGGGGSAWPCVPKDSVDWLEQLTSSETCLDFGSFVRLMSASMPVE